MLPSVWYLLAKVHGTIAICTGTAGGKRILLTDDSGRSGSFKLVPEAGRNHFHFDSNCTSHGRPARARSSNFPKTFNKLDQQVLKGLFHSSHFSELGIYARQWSLIPRSCKITSPTKLYPAH
ncbi:hypothetical protein TNCV_1966041 [Trichonephila clavipes]|nr:hypothetical protein TNCV_1966041 [Trichonephila clavipes]